MRNYYAILDSLEGDWHFTAWELDEVDYIFNREYVIEYDAATVFATIVNVYKMPCKYLTNDPIPNWKYSELIHCKKIMNVTERKFLRILKRYGFKFNRDKYNKQIYGK